MYFLKYTFERYNVLIVNLNYKKWAGNGYLSFLSFSPQS